MIPMHPQLISQLIAGRQADLMASARQQRRARQARAARRARPAQRGHAALMLAALGRLARRRSSPGTIQTPAAGPGVRQQSCLESPNIPLPDKPTVLQTVPLCRPQT